MEPRIFVSSTFYDLKYVREQLGNFIEGYGFKPVLFENGDVGYGLGEELDQSCFAEMKNCDMAILIIGGRYGSPVSEERLEDGTARDNFEKYTSVTCREFNTAINNKIPVYVFIETSVNQQYSLYHKNKDAIESKKFELEFPAVDNINVFRFIYNIRSIPHIQIETFTRTNDIVSYLKKQWAALFRQYLRERREVGAIKSVETPMQEVLSKVKQIEITLDRIVGKVVGADTDEIDAIQAEKEKEDTASKFARTFEFLMLDPSMEKIKNYLEFFINEIACRDSSKFLELPFSDDPAELKEFYSALEHYDTQVTDVKLRLAFDSRFIDNIRKYKTDIVPKLLEVSNLKLMKFL